MIEKSTAWTAQAAAVATAVAAAAVDGGGGGSQAELAPSALAGGVWGCPWGQ